MAASATTLEGEIVRVELEDGRTYVGELQSLHASGRRFTLATPAPILISADKVASVEAVTSADAERIRKEQGIGEPLHSSAHAPRVTLGIGGSLATLGRHAYLVGGGVVVMRNWTLSGSRAVVSFGGGAGYHGARTRCVDDASQCASNVGVLFVPLELRIGGFAPGPRLLSQAILGIGAGVYPLETTRGPGPPIGAVLMTPTGGVSLYRLVTPRESKRQLGIGGEFRFGYVPTARMGSVGGTFGIIFG